MNETLRQFNGDVHTKEALIDFLHAFVAEEGVRRIYAKESVEAVADAKDIIDKAFDKLQEIYGTKPRPPEQTNQAA